MLDLLPPRTRAQRPPSGGQWAPVVDALTRRGLLAGTAGALGLGLTAACGDSPTSTADKPATRTVQGARGPVQVPVEPKRVAALVGSNDIDVIALGITPVYAGTFAKGWMELPAGIVTADAVPPNVETVASARPDLLLGWDWLVDEPAWSKLTALAPGVPLPEDKTWRDTFLVLADAVNRRAQGETVLAEFGNRVKAVRDRFAARPKLRLAHIAFYKPGMMTWYGQDRDTTEIMSECGIEVDGPEKTLRDASTERLGELTAPWLVVYGSGDNGPSMLAEAKRSPLWAALPAVKAGQVVEVKDGIWTGAGLLWARALVDDLERRFLS
jgi:iron complex transport system substrate-binding protein